MTSRPYGEMEKRHVDHEATAGFCHRIEPGSARNLRSKKMKAHGSVMPGLNEALAYSQGKDIGARVHHIEVAAVDVAAIRARTGLSQSAFARSIGVAKGTLLNWEHGRRRPTGPAQVLLAMIEKKPSLVSELLS
jgi:putative transcriptional regulator